MRNQIRIEERLGQPLAMRISGTNSVSGELCQVDSGIKEEVKAKKLKREEKPLASG
jgi:hypothetical protein